MNGDSGLMRGAESFVLANSGKIRIAWACLPGLTGMDILNDSVSRLGTYENEESSPVSSYLLSSFNVGESSQYHIQREASNIDQKIVMKK
jgi:hypothetical protein